MGRVDATLRLFVRHWIAQASYPYHCYFDYLARHHRTNALRRSCGDQISGKQRHHLRDVADHNVQGKKEISRVAVLPDGAIDGRLHADAAPGIDLVGDDRSDRTKSVEPLGAGPLSIFILQIARGEVIHARVAENVGPHILGLGELVTRLADDDPKLTFIVGPLRY